MKILIIKTGALGDVLRTSFLAQALKDKYKKTNSKIFWLTSQQSSQFFINNPYINELIISGERDNLKKIKFDLVINLEESKEDARFTSLLKPKKIIGVFLNKNGEIEYTQETSYWFDMSMISRLGKEKADILKNKNKKTHRQIMSEIIGMDWRKYEPFLRLTDAQRKMAQEFSNKHHLSKSDLIIGINTGAADRWPKELSIKKTIEIIENLYKKYNTKILLFGGPNEIKRNKEIIKLAESPIIDTGCGNNLVEFPALVSVCNIVITTDSLGLHVALALKRKTICLIGPTSSSEIDLYNLGEKIIAKSKDVCSYKTETDCMDKIDLNEIKTAIDKILKQKITLLITAFKEPKTIIKAVEGALAQKTSRKYEIVVSAPDNETLDAIKKHKNLKIFKDPGKGKSYALNLIFEKLKTDILILTDGDVFISDNVVENFANLFLDSEIGCATGRPIPIENKKTKYGFWANFLFDSAHRLRKKAFQQNKFLECSGYLFAFRKEFIRKIPLDVAEDTLIPYLFWQKGYKIGYSENSRVYVKNVDNFRDWINQKIRTSKAHETLYKYVDIKTTPRIKTFKTEAKGFFSLFSYPENFQQFWWSSLLALSRFYMWMKVFYDTKFKKKHYQDAWKRVESAK
ncbi:MAG: heptosyltransferase II [archaeon GW2011_AR19]|nr:MAG: heptosyltransferase II [archaeon GW2011_AR19]